MSRSRTAASRSAASGLWQTTNRSHPVGVAAARGHPHLLDPQVARHAPVAPRSGERGGGLGVGLAQLLGVDVVPATAGEVGPVGRGGEPAVGDPDQPVQPPVGQVVAVRRMIAVSAVLPGKVQHRIGTPSRVTAIPITTWGSSGRWSLECP